LPLSQFLVALNKLEGEACGIPHLAKNERDVRHPVIADGMGPKKRGDRVLMQTLKLIFFQLLYGSTEVFCSP
jgi:hypothetical protein